MVRPRRDPAAFRQSGHSGTCRTTAGPSTRPSWRTPVKKRSSPNGRSRRRARHSSQSGRDRKLASSKCTHGCRRTVRWCPFSLSPEHLQFHPGSAAQAHPRNRGARRIVTRTSPSSSAPGRRTNRRSSGFCGRPRGSRFRLAAGDGGRRHDLPGTAPSGPSFRALSLTLRQKLWAPLAPHLVDARRVFVVPDGALNLMPLAALPTTRGQLTSMTAQPSITFQRNAT